MPMFRTPRMESSEGKPRLTLEPEPATKRRSVRSPNHGSSTHNQMASDWLEMALKSTAVS